MTMSFVEQLTSNRQSYQTTYTRPSPSISAEGRSGARIPPGTVAAVIGDTVKGPSNVAPPSWEVYDSIAPAAARPFAIGMMTVPVLGWTSGWPPVAIP